MYEPKTVAALLIEQAYKILREIGTPEDVINISSKVAWQYSQKEKYGFFEEYLEYQNGTHSAVLCISRMPVSNGKMDERATVRQHENGLSTGTIMSIKIIRVNQCGIVKRFCKALSCFCAMFFLKQNSAEYIFRPSDAEKLKDILCEHSVDWSCDIDNINNIETHNLPTVLKTTTG